MGFEEIQEIVRKFVDQAGPEGSRRILKGGLYEGWFSGGKQAWLRPDATRRSGPLTRGGVYIHLLLPGETE